MYTPHDSGSNDSSSRSVFSVSQLNRHARQLLETHLPLLWVEGELSNVSMPASGHWYFTLKDDQAQVRSCMFRNRNMLVKFRPQQGQHVLLRARVSLYEGRGDYQLIAEHMEEAGTGALQRAFEALKQQLANEGLFDTAHKKPLPEVVKHLAVITSGTGAAIRDVLHVIARRFPSLAVTVLPVAVQGKEAPPQLVRALEVANQAGLFDTVLMTRGGGSLEDLWAFNDECVARAIFASHLPVVSAIGHEVDFTIADFVADVRAPTPSAAAEILTPDGEEWLDRFCGFEVLLEEAMQRRLAASATHIRHLRQRLRHPRERLEQQFQRLDNLELRLHAHLKTRLASANHHAAQLQSRLMQQSPKHRVLHQQQHINGLSNRLLNAQYNVLATQKSKLAASARVLHSLSPLTVLDRGFSVTTPEGSSTPITDWSSVKPNDRLVTRVATGVITSVVASSETIKTPDSNS